MHASFDAWIVLTLKYQLSVSSHLGILNTLGHSILQHNCLESWSKSLRVWFYNILWFIFFPTQFLLRPIKVAYNWVQKVCNWFCFVYERLLSSQDDVIVVVSKVHFSKVLYLSVVSSICSLFPEKMQYVCQSNHEKVSLNPCFRPQLTNISRRLWLWKPPDNTNGPDL